MKYYSNLSLQLDTAEINYKKILDMFLLLSEHLDATQINYLAVIQSYFDEKGYQRVKKAHEYKRNIKNRIDKLDDNYNLYGIGFNAMDCIFSIDWNKNRQIIHLSIDSNRLIEENFVLILVKFIEICLNVNCLLDIETLNKEYI